MAEDGGARSLCAILEPSDETLHGRCWCNQRSQNCSTRIVRLCSLEDKMRTRRSVRVILVDQRQRVLLIKVEDSLVSDPEASWLTGGFWVTLGGELKAGETPQFAARREVQEETGFAGIDVGPVIGSGQQTLVWRGEDTALTETFVAAYLEGDADRLTGDCWTEHERSPSLKCDGGRWRNLQRRMR